MCCRYTRKLKFNIIAIIISLAVKSLSSLLPPTVLKIQLILITHIYCIGFYASMYRIPKEITCREHHHTKLAIKM